jgi:hypothetical protein
MKNSCFSRALGALAATLAVLAGPLQGQSPIGKELQLDPGPDGIYGPDIAFYPDGRFLIGYQTVDGNGDDKLWVRRYSQLGALSGHPILVRPGLVSHLTDAAGIKLVLGVDGGFWTLWYEMLPARFGPSARRYSEAGEPLADALPLQGDSSFFPVSGLSIEEDRLTVLGSTLDPDTDQRQPRIAEFDARDGALLRSFAVDQPWPFTDPLALFLESPGSLFVAWHRVTGESQTSGVWGQRLTRDGAPLAPPLLFNRRTQPAWGGPQVTRDGNGNFIAVWQARDQDGPYEDIYAQRVSASGEKVGGIFVVNTVRKSAQRYPTVAADRLGNFVVAWQSFDPAIGFSGWHLEGQLFRKDGRRVGRGFVIPNPGGDNDTWNPKVTFGPNGTFLLDYVATGPVLIRRYSASPGDEVCVWRGDTVQCDTGRTEGKAEWPLALQLYPGDVPLFGDVDGDGRADPCVRRGRNFLCDTEHEGTLSWQVSFGKGGVGEIPLMGDVNGDGRAEACLWSERELRCDVAHDGGRAEWTVRLGQPRDIPLLGDVDGDGRADPCVYRAGQFLCDTAHDGSAGWRVTFGRPGDQPVLGDFDGDGRADPCVFRAGELLCDTAHDGGSHPAHLVFGRPGDRPLLGNLDGL